MLVIPHVLALDLGFAAVAWLLARHAPSPRTRRLLRVLFFYVLVEAAFHVPMEAAAARLLPW